MSMIGPNGRSDWLCFRCILHRHPNLFTFNAYPPPFVGTLPIPFNASTVLLLEENAAAATIRGTQTVRKTIPPFPPSHRRCMLYPLQIVNLRGLRRSTAPSSCSATVRAMLCWVGLKRKVRSRELRVTEKGMAKIQDLFLQRCQKNTYFYD